MADFRSGRRQGAPDLFTRENLARWDRIWNLLGHGSEWPYG
jgi:hypothetical protein